MNDGFIWLAIRAAIFYGFAGPLMKYTHQSGVSTRDFIFIASLTTLLAALFWPSSEALFSTLALNKGLVAGLLAGILLTGGFISINQSLAVPLGLASVVLIITASNPLIGSLISLLYLGEWKKVILPMLIAGSLFIIAGVIMVAFSTKTH